MEIGKNVSESIKFSLMDIRDVVWLPIDARAKFHIWSLVMDSVWNPVGRSVILSVRNMVILW